MSRRLGALAAVVAVLLVAATSALVLRRDDEASPGAAGPSTSTTTTATTTDVPAAEDPSPASELDRAVAEIGAFVAEMRGKQFRRLVQVEQLESDAFRERLLADVEDERADTEIDERVLRALKLLPDDIDLFDTLVDFIGDSVVGFYDPETDALVVKAGELTPYARVTLAHELTHALDDQHFELHRPDLEEATDESFLAFASLVEGNAVRVDEAFEASLSEDDRERVEDEEREAAAGIDLEGVPDVIPQSLVFPYTAGPVFARALARAGGEEQIDDALRVPPTTSEHILDPQGWLRGERAVAVPAPPADGEVIDEGAYGLWSIVLTLAPELGEQAANAAAVGWGGDAYVAWDEGDRTCVRAVFVMDTPADLNELAAAWEEWAEAHGDATVERAGATVGFTACG